MSQEGSSIYSSVVQAQTAMTLPLNQPKNATIPKPLVCFTSLLDLKLGPYVLTN